MCSASSCGATGDGAVRTHQASRLVSVQRLAPRRSARGDRHRRAEQPKGPGCDPLKGPRALWAALASGRWPWWWCCWLRRRRSRSQLDRHRRFHRCCGCGCCCCGCHRGLCHPRRGEARGQPRDQPGRQEQGSVCALMPRPRLRAGARRPPRRRPTAPRVGRQRGAGRVHPRPQARAFPNFVPLL